MATLPNPNDKASSSTGSSETQLSQVRELTDYLAVSLCGEPPQQRLPYDALVRCAFGWPVVAERERELLSIVDRYAEAQINDHPYLYKDEAALWQEVPGQPRQLTGAGVAVALEAWCQNSLNHPARYSADDHTALRFWRCHAAHIIRQVFASSLTTLPAHLAGDAASLQHQLRMSNQHFRECFRSYAADHNHRLPDYNRQRYAPRFSRIQAYGLQPPAPSDHSGQPTVFFLPATQILTHMQKYFRSSTMFEEHAWRSTDAYLKYAQFTNIVLLNLCGVVMRQITTLFRIHEAATAAAASTTRDSDALFMKVDDIYELQTLNRYKR